MHDTFKEKYFILYQRKQIHFLNNGNQQSYVSNVPSKIHCRRKFRGALILLQLQCPPPHL